MGVLDKIKGLVGEHDDKVDLAVDQAKNLVDSLDEDEESSDD
jgi:hypothetical protein